MYNNEHLNIIKEVASKLILLDLKYRTEIVKYGPNKGNRVNTEILNFDVAQIYAEELLGYIKELESEKE
jgi:hypothetical protein